MERDVDAMRGVDVVVVVVYGEKAIGGGVMGLTVNPLIVVREDTAVASSNSHVFGTIIIEYYINYSL